MERHTVPLWPPFVIVRGRADSLPFQPLEAARFDAKCDQRFLSSFKGRVGAGSQQGFSTMMFNAAQISLYQRVYRDEVSSLSKRAENVVRHSTLSSGMFATEWLPLLQHRVGSIARGIQWNATMCIDL